MRGVRMKLIIDIPDKDYDEICKDYFLNDDIYTAIKNGIPLDDIRAELQDEYNDAKQWVGADNYLLGLKKAIEIIDKYRK